MEFLAIILHPDFIELYLSDDTEATIEYPDYSSESMSPPKASKSDEHKEWEHQLGIMEINIERGH